MSGVPVELVPLPELRTVLLQVSTFLYMSIAISMHMELPSIVRISQRIGWFKLLPCIALQGEWRDETAGGCDLQPTWKKNPRYLLAIQRSTRVRCGGHMLHTSYDAKAKCKCNVGIESKLWFIE